MHTVIIGNGIGGNAAAFGIRKHDRNAEITIVTRENCPEYEPGALPYYISGTKARQDLFLNSFDDYSNNNINLVVDEAREIDPEQKKLYLGGGNELIYDNLVIATGGDLIRPPFKGIEKDGVFGCKVLADADALYAREGKVAVVIGSGLIGIEACEALQKKGFKIYLLELFGWIMPRTFDEYPARKLENGLTKNGINVLTNEKLISINGDNKVESVTTDKRSIMCDTVVLATGVAPATGLARQAGAEIGLTRGIKVNEKCMTTVPDIYACGDCAETTDAITGERTLIQLRHNALEQGEVIARNCAGIPSIYKGAWSITRAHYFDTNSVSIGKTFAGIEDKTDVEVIEREFGDDYCRLILNKGKLAGAQAIGRFAKDMGILFGAMWRKDDLAWIRANWDKVTNIKSTYPWNYRVIGRYMNLKS
jgi:NADH oxidase (H2O2-forming)